MKHELANKSEPSPQPYRPSNGTEGEAFMDRWCYRCAKYGDDDSEAQGGCTIVLQAMASAIGDSDYPAEWQFDATGAPVCTAFTTSETGTPRCPHTSDMFGGEE